MDEYGNYHLVLEDFSTRDRKYMDFQGKQAFSPKEFSIRINVPLAAIDELTTHFINDTHLKMSLAHKDEMDGPKDRVFITYQQNGEKQLECVYDDEVLAHIASQTIGAKKGLLNLNDEVTRTQLYNIFQEVIKPGSTFLSEALTENTNTTFVNSHNSNLLREIRRHASEKQSQNDRTFRRVFAKEDAFGLYKEFRALYISYKKYIAKKKAERDRLLRGILPDEEEQFDTSSVDPEHEKMYEVKNPDESPIGEPPIPEKKEQPKSMQLDMFSMFGSAFKR